jgi:hypothetical protein
MKYSLILLTLIIGSGLYGQTDSIEKAAIFGRFSDKQTSQKKIQETCFKWNKTLKEIGKYPDLPIDKNGLVHYSFLQGFKNLDKSKLFNRTLEWLSMTYGIIPYYLYSNMEDGKIILRNSFSIGSDITCNYSYIISIKNEKILIEFTNIGYQLFYEGHYSGDTWIADKTINLGISQVYPIILKDPTEWNLYLNMFQATNQQFNNEQKDLSSYIVNYDSNYSF